MRKIALCFLAAILICLGPLALKKVTHTPKHLERAAYFWKTSLYEEDITLLKKRNIHKLYVKIMDISWNPVYKAYPATTTELFKSITEGIEVVPVVFITNETMKNCTEQDIDVLAEKLLLKAAKLVEKFETIKELQIDCDWTSSTKNNYFKLLSRLKAASGSRLISATIRLYQYKHRSKTGVPPVDRGMLMLYNMGQINNYNEHNSIFNETEAWKYLQGTDAYDLPLDMALPAFDWAIVFEQKKFSHIIHHFTRQMADTCSFLVKNPNGYYKMTADYWSDGLESTLYYGNEIRIEDITQRDLLNAATIAEKAANTDHFTVSVFEINSHSFNQLDSTVYEKVLDRIK